MAKRAAEDLSAVGLKHSKMRFVNLSIIRCEYKTVSSCFSVYFIKSKCVETGDMHFMNTCVQTVYRA